MIPIFLKENRIVYYQNEQPTLVQDPTPESTGESVEADEIPFQTVEQKMESNREIFLRMAKDIQKSVNEEFKRSTLEKMLQFSTLFLDHYSNFQSGNTFMETVRLMKTSFERHEDFLEENFSQAWMSMKQSLEELERNYWAEANYTDLLESGYVRPSDDLVRRNLLIPEDSMWPRKMRLVTAGRKSETMKKVQVNLKKVSPESMTFDSFRNISGEILRDTLQKLTTLKPGGLENPFVQALGADLFLSIPVLELISPDYEPPLRVNVFRAVMDEGFQPNAIPSIHDQEASYGLGQTTLGTYEGLWKWHKEKCEALNLPRKFEDCIGVEDQLKTTILLTALNLEEVYRALCKDKRKGPPPVIPEEWFDPKQASEEQSRDQREFVRIITAAIHNAGPRPIKGFLEKAMRQKPQNLGQLIVFFTQEIESDPRYANAARHARQVVELCDEFEEMASSAL